MEPIVVEVTRGEVVEARHIVHAVAVRDGRIELAAGDASLVTFLRSSAKPIQALPVVRARPDLDDEEIALACASHLAAPEQLAVVRRLLSRCAGRRGRARVRRGADPDRAQLLREARRLPRAVPCPRLAHARVPPARASVPAGDAARGRGGGRGGAVVTGGRGGRVRRADLRAAARARRALLRAAGLARRRRARRARDACAPGSPTRPGRDGRADDPRARRLGREGRRRGPLLRRARRTASGWRSRSSTVRSAPSSPRSRTCSPVLGIDPGALGSRPGDEQPRRARRRAARPPLDLIDDRESDPIPKAGSPCIRCAGCVVWAGTVIRLVAFEGLSSVNRQEKEGVHALGRNRSSGDRGAAQARRARAGEGVPDVRRDRQVRRGRRSHQGAAGGLHDVPHRSLDRARRGRAAQGTAPRAADRASRGGRDRTEARPHRRAVPRLPAALPPRDRQGAAPDGRPGGLPREADRARRRCARNST